MVFRKKHFLFLFCFLITSCSSGSIIKGKFIIATPNRYFKDINEVTVMLTQFNKVKSYTTNIADSGELKLKVEETGSWTIGFYFYKYKLPWDSVKPMIATDELYIDLQLNKSTDIGDIYLSDHIEVAKPREGQRFQEGENIHFQWENNLFADCYTLTILKENSVTGGSDPYIGVYLITETDINLYKILELPYRQN